MVDRARLAAFCSRVLSALTVIVLLAPSAGVGQQGFRTWAELVDSRGHLLFRLKHLKGC